MKFDPKIQIGGYPAVDVRAFLRRVSSAHLGFSAKDAQSVAQLSEKELARFLKCLAEEDLLEPFLLLNRQHGWRTTVRGNALAMARAGAPMTRATAESLMTEFLARVVEVN